VGGGRSDAGARPEHAVRPAGCGTYQLQRIQRAPDAVLKDARDRQRRLGTLTRGKVTLLTSSTPTASTNGVARSPTARWSACASG